MPWFGRSVERVAEDRWTRLHTRRIYIVPTATGVAFAALLLVLLIGAINYDNNLIFALTFLLTGLALVAMLYTYRNLAQLEVRAGTGRPGFAGERVGFRLWARPGDARPRERIEFGTAEAEPQFIDVGALTAAPVWLHRVAPHRGRLPLGRIRVATRFPLGLFRAWAYLDVVHTEPVYPRPAPPEMPRPGAGRGDNGREAGARAGMDDFAGLRDYRTGDSLRHVDWKAVAREHGPLTKQFTDAAVPDDWFDFSSLTDSDPEVRLSRLCRWILDAERARRRYGLRMPAITVDPGQGDTHRDRCLLALVDFGASQ